MALQSVTNPITEEIEMSTENGFDRLPTTAVAQTGIGATKATGFSFKDEFASREIDFAQVVARPDSPATISFGFNEFDFSIEVDIEDPAEAFCSTSNAQFCLDFASDPVSRGAILGGRWEWLGSGGLKGGYLDFPARGVVVVPLPNTQDSIVVGGDGNGVRGVVHHLDNFEVTLDADRVHMSGMLRVGKSASGSSGSGFSFSLVPNTDPTTVADGNGWVERPTDIFVGGAFIELEEGTVSGISIGFDERRSTPAAPELLEHWYGPDARDIVGMSIRVDGELLCQASLPTLNGAVDDPNSLQTGPNDSGIDALGWAQLTIEMPANYDDSTTGDDITVTWKGQEVEFVGAACSVPEPSQGLLAFTALLGSALVRRKFCGLCR